MNLLERKTKEAELAGVEAARKQLEVRILQCEQEIERVKDHINVQLKKEEEIKKILIGENNV